MDMPSMVEGGVCLGSEAMWLTPNPGLFKKKKKLFIVESIRSPFSCNYLFVYKCWRGVMQLEKGVWLLD